MASPEGFSDRVYKVVDWFIPARLKANGDIVQGVRMFLFSHIFGPFLGHTISLYVLYLQGRPDQPWWIFFGAITAFWPFTLALRYLGWYVPLALVSIQNLIFCILWGCYHYGGISSPILPWLITVPLLAFFYLPTRRTRIIVSCLIVANLVAFYFIYSSLGFPNTIPLSKLAGLGMVSTFCAGVYVSMMALYYAKIVSSQSKLEHEIEVHRATARELQRATEEAQRTTRAKAEFLAKMSHELRTPLNAIIGFSEILLEDVAGDEQKAEDLGKINGAGKRLLHLINDLLDLSKLEAGKMEVYPEPFELEAFLDAIVAEWRMPIEESGNELRVDRSGPLGAVVNEAARLRQAVNHLLGNAAKFTRNGRITLRVSHAQGEVRLAVEDTGAGIEADRFGTLFETFGSRDDETSSKYGEDPGLGLPLTHRLCTLMGGTLSVDSVVGRGSCFTIRIPSNLRVQATAEELTDTDAAVAPGRDRQARPILVIDDDQHVLDLLERMLARQGLWPVLSADAAEGIARARQLNPAVIILDIEMPSFDGWQALREIRDDPLLRSCPVILLTVNDDFARGRTLGADAHLLKPIDREALFRCIGRLDPLLVGTDSLEPVPAE